MKVSTFFSFNNFRFFHSFFLFQGGLKAVLWTDVFQSLLMFFALLSVIIKGSTEVGGFEEMLSIAEKGGRLNFFK